MEVTNSKAASRAVAPTNGTNILSALRTILELDLFKQTSAGTAPAKDARVSAEITWDGVSDFPSIRSKSHTGRPGGLRSASTSLRHRNNALTARLPTTGIGFAIASRALRLTVTTHARIPSNGVANRDPPTRRSAEVLGVWPSLAFWLKVALSQLRQIDSFLPQRKL